MAKNIEISVISPVFNEEEVISDFLNRITLILKSITESFEIICVNDGSKDGTLDLIVERRKTDPRIHIINLSRNFGKEAALTAGLDHARGRAVIPIDADLQDDPELIPDMVSKWREGYDVVVAVRSNRKSDSFLKRTTANAFYRIIKRTSGASITPNAGDFRLLDRRVVNALKQLPERTRFMKGLFPWLGFHQAFITYKRAPRAAGASKWRYWRLWNFALEGITSFTSLPLLIWTYVGSIIAFSSFIYALYIVLRTLIYGVDVPGYASIIVLLLFLSGINLLSIGILGEYVARIFLEVKRRPLYIIRDIYGLENRLKNKTNGDDF